MSQNSLQRTIRLGRGVDPTILNAMRNGSAKDFRPSLNYHFAAGGKRMRAALVVLSCGAAGGRPKDAVKPAAVVEMIHNYSLVMDDLIDRGDVRRGRPTVRAQLGESVALLVAMFYREVLDDLIQASPFGVKIRKVAVEAMKEIIDGERLDLLLEQAGRKDPYLIRNRLSNPSFNRYLDMIGKKTAALFKTSGQIGAISANASQKVVNALGSFGWKAGLAFQIMDDVLDICGDKTGKQQAKDVVEHKLGNATVLIALRFLSEKRRTELMKILRTERVTRNMASRAKSIICETPAGAESTAIARRYLQDAKKQLSVLKESSYRQQLSKLADQIVNRTY